MCTTNIVCTFALGRVRALQHSGHTFGGGGAPAMANRLFSPAPEFVALLHVVPPAQVLRSI